MTTNLKNIPYVELAIRGSEIANDIAVAQGEVPQPLLPPPGDLSAAQAELLGLLGDRRLALVGIEQDLQSNQTNIRLRLDALGLASGTLMRQPMAGLALGEATSHYIQQTTIQPYLDQARRAYRQDVARLVVQSFRQAGDVAKLKDAATRSKDLKTLQDLADSAWTAKASILDARYLDSFPEAERESIFKQGIVSLLDLSRADASLNFLDLKKDTTELKAGVSQVRKILSAIEQKQEQGFQDLKSAIQSNQIELRKQLAQQAADSRFLQDNIYWNQLGPSQKAEALRRGWLAEKFETPQDRQKEIMKYERIAKFSEASRKLDSANEFLAGMSSVADILKLPDDTKKAISNAQRNIKTVQTAVNVAGHLATQNYFGALTAAGGLFGGSNADPAAAQYQALIQRLDVIDAKLDQIIKLLEETRAALSELRTELTSFAADTDRRLGGIDLQLRGLRDGLTSALLKLDGLVECDDIRVLLVPGTGGNPWKFNANTAAFQSYNSRKEFYSKLTIPEAFSNCGRFLRQALLAQGPSDFSAYFLTRFSAQDLDAILFLSNNVAVHQAAQALKNNLRSNIYRAMRAYHMEKVDSTYGSPADLALFALLASTPLDYRKIKLDQLLSASANSAIRYRLHGAGEQYGSFISVTDRHIDTEQLQRFKFHLDVYSSFAILQEPSGTKLREPSEIELRNSKMVAEVVELYRSFKNVLTIASAQQAMLAGAAVVHAALKDLQTSRFGRPLDSCWSHDKPAGLSPSDLAGCTVAKVWSKHSSKNHDQAVPLVSNELVALPGEQGAMFRAIARLNSDHCEYRPLAAPSAASEEQAVISKYSGLWQHAVVTCLMERNPRFARNLILYSVLSQLRSVSANSPEYLAATSTSNSFIARQMFGNLPISPNERSSGWSFVIYTPFGVRVEWDIPLPSAIANGISLDTDVGKEITLMRNAVDSKLLELQLCDSDDKSCTDNDRALLANIVEHQRVLNAD